MNSFTDSVLDLCQPEPGDTVSKALAPWRLARSDRHVDGLSRLGPKTTQSGQFSLLVWDATPRWDDGRSQRHPPKSRAVARSARVHEHKKGETSEIDEVVHGPSPRAASGSRPSGSRRARWCARPVKDLGQNPLKNGQFSLLFLGCHTPRGQWQIAVPPPGEELRSGRVPE
jgi:hypothetical protein